MTPKFQIAHPSLHAELRARVQAYFQLHALEPRGAAPLFLKAAAFIALTLVLYVHLLVGHPAAPLALAECVALGCLISGIGFNIMHDGSHDSFSDRRLFNRCAALTLEALGGSSYLWRVKHCILHHSFTNVEGVDDDMNIGDLMCLNPHQQRHRLHRFQHLYFWFLYMMFYLSWIFFADYQHYFLRSIGTTPIPAMNRGEHVKFWLGKVLNLVLFAVIPIAFVGFRPWLIGFFVTLWTTGLVSSLVFQLAHTVDIAAHPLPAGHDHRLPDEFALHQIRTTANFATSSRLTTWLVGGLNYQIEHHLFPKVAHTHYPRISAIVREVCAERGIAYMEHRGVRQAIVAHVRHLRELGQGVVVLPDGPAARGAVTS